MQVFWGVVLPLAVPVLAVVALFSFVATVNEFVIASVLLEDRNSFTLPLGMRSFIDKQYAEQWGPFAAGVLLRRCQWRSSLRSCRSSSSAG